MNKNILRLAVPSIVSNITVPLLGLVDLAIVGHIGDARMIGAIAVGSMLFNLVYWVFGFLRMGTSGLTAQAYGAGNNSELELLLRRTVLIGFGVAGAMLLLQKPLLSLAMLTVSPEPDVAELVHTYYNICIWGAPAVLVSNGLMGWFIGMQNTRTPMFVAIVQNISNILLSLLLVFLFGMQLKGVAAGTLIAQYVGLAATVFFLRKEARKHGLCLSATQRDSAVSADSTGESTAKGWDTMFRVNRDIFLRTLCLVGVNLYFLSMGARSGATVLAVNTLLMEFYILFSFILDGFAFAGEALGGRYWGAGEKALFAETVKRLFVWGLGMTLMFTILYIFCGHLIVSLLTSDMSVVVASRQYMSWTWLIPLAGVAAFVWDGIYIGITATRGMLLSAIVSAVFFFVIDHFLHPYYGNHALWMSFLVFLAMRGIMQTIIYFLRLAPSR